MSKLIGKFKSNHGVVDLGEVRIINRAHIDVVRPTVVTYSLDDKKYFSTKLFISSNDFEFNDLVCRYIKMEYDFELEVYEGTGYIGEFNKEWTDLFVQDQYWVGGDGLFSFNLNGRDNYSCDKKNLKTLCVFGDTFACTLDKTYFRLSPLAMPNNSYCIINGTEPKQENVSFHINEDELGHCIAYISPDNALSYEGTMASNLVDYNKAKTLLPYMSSYNPKKDIELEFDLNSNHEIDYIDIENFSIGEEDSKNRGIKNFDIYLDGEFYKNIETNDYYLKEQKIIRIDINKTVHKVKFVISNIIGKGNFGGANGKEPFFGLNKVYFHEKNSIYLDDVQVKTNSEFLKKDKHAWFWLQDGIIIDQKFYSLPLVVTSDLTQPDGFQFRVEGISLIEAPIENEEVNFKKLKQRPTNLMRKSDDREWMFGCAFFDNSFTSGEKNADGYIYIYGYTSKFFELEYGKRMRVARVKKEDFEDINKWTYFDGKEFVRDMEKAIPVLDHVSCELSVSYDNGKYIAVFSYDVQSRYVAYALSDTPYGPFDELRIAYVCDENYCEHMYIYNAKGHPHLSKEGNLLVSYNINTSSFDENIKYGRTYGPRFINLIRKGGE